jgi:hypothetical protein
MRHDHPVTEFSVQENHDGKITIMLRRGFCGTSRTYNFTPEQARQLHAAIGDALQPDHPVQGLQAGQTPQTPQAG